MNPFRLLLLAASRRHNRNRLVAALRATRSALKASEAAREIGNETAAGLHTDIYRMQRDTKAAIDEWHEKLREANDVIEAVEARLKTADEENGRLGRELSEAREELKDKAAFPTDEYEALKLDLTVTRMALDKSGEYGRWAESELKTLRAQLADAAESLAETIESEAELARQLAEERELISRLDADNAQLSGQLQDLGREQRLWVRHLGGCETALAIQDDDIAKARSNQ